MLKTNLTKLKGGQRWTRVAFEHPKNHVSSIVNIPIQENPTTSTENIQKKIKLGKGEVVAKFQTLQANKSMVEALEAQLQLGKEKLEAMTVEFHKANIVATKAEEKVALKAIDKLRLTFHNKSLEERTSKDTHTTK
jgi:hypothetical protein